MSEPYFWIIDTRNIWPGTTITDAAPDALPLLSPPERTRALAFHFLRDAKLSLAAALLKRLFVTTALALPPTAWPAITFTRAPDPTHGKPCHAPADARPSPLDFNVSHQAGLAVLAGSACAARARVGVDVVCAHERDDVGGVARAGFDAWVEMYAEVFSAADIAAIKAVEPGGAAATARIRRFYAFWALKEAYVKLVGEGLLARWLRTVEFRGVRVPGAGRGEEGLGEVVEGIEVWRDGARVHGVEMVLQGFEENHMVATAVWRAEGVERVVPRYRVLDLREDVYAVAAQ